MSSTTIISGATENGGGAWTLDAGMEAALTEQGAFPVDLTGGAGADQVLVRDMVFDPADAAWRIAIGPAGVF